MTVQVDEIQKAYKLHGRVQGVGFRWWTRQQARDLDLRGTVRNCRDGTVDVTLAGPPQAVERMESLLQQGPPSARVQRVEELSPPEHLPDVFQIIR